MAPVSTGSRHREEGSFKFCREEDDAKTKEMGSSGTERQREEWCNTSQKKERKSSVIGTRN